MENNSMKFFTEADVENGSVLFYPFHAYVDIRKQRLIFNRKFECDNICQCIMPEVLLIYAKKIVIITENIVNCLNLFVFFQ